MIGHVNDTHIAEFTADCQAQGEIRRPFRCVSPADEPGALPFLRLEDLSAQQSDFSEFSGLQVRLCNVPSRGRSAVIENADAYQFQFRPRGSKGTRLWITEFGKAGRLGGRGAFLLIPPKFRVQVDWINASGRVAIFCLTPGFIASVSDQAGLPASFLANRSPLSFSTDRRFEELCELLVEETEVSCPHGRSYFEALAHALVVSMLVRWHERRPPLKGNVPAVRWGIREAIGRLESDFSERISVSELARTAKLSVDYFGAAFRRATGTTPHQYLLRVRLNRARAMMTQKPRPLPLAEIALACGFADQTHFCRHFRRYLGMTPTEFLQSQNTGAQQYPWCGRLGQRP